MDALGFGLQSLVHLPSFSALGQVKLGRQNFHNKEIADGPLLFTSRKDLLCAVVCSTQAHGDRIPQRNSAKGKISEGDADTVYQSSEAKPSKNQEEIISIFRRIRSSISRESVNAKKISSKQSESPSVDSVLQVLHPSRTQVKGKTARKEGEKASGHRRSPSRKELKADYSSALNSKLTRPPSNFVRRSPIPALNQVETVNLMSEALPAIDDGEEKLPKLKDRALQSVEGMKLPELKELAKSKGLKGYSKLKRADLIKLLSTL